MKLLLICILFICKSIYVSCSEENTFEFGRNKGRIAFTDSGTMGLFDKIRRIPIVVPECQTIRYVRVDVSNALGPPAVKFDWNLSTVLISYRPLQFSLSTYTVVAKTEPSPDCYELNEKKTDDAIVPIAFYGPI